MLGSARIQAQASPLAHKTVSATGTKETHQAPTTVAPPLCIPLLHFLPADDATRRTLLSASTPLCANLEWKVVPASRKLASLLSAVKRKWSALPCIAHIQLKPVYDAKTNTQARPTIDTTSATVTLKEIHEALGSPTPLVFTYSFGAGAQPATTTQQTIAQQQQQHGPTATTQPTLPLSSALAPVASSIAPSSSSSFSVSRPPTLPIAPAPVVPSTTKPALNMMPLLERPVITTSSSSLSFSSAAAASSSMAPTPPPSSLPLFAQHLSTLLPSTQITLTAQQLMALFPAQQLQMPMQMQMPQFNFPSGIAPPSMLPPTMTTTLVGRVGTPSTILVSAPQAQPQLARPVAAPLPAASSLLPPSSFRPYPTSSSAVTAEKRKTQHERVTPGMPVVAPASAPSVAVVHSKMTATTTATGDDALPSSLTFAFDATPRRASAVKKSLFASFNQSQSQASPMMSHTIGRLQFPSTPIVTISEVKAAAQIATNVSSSSSSSSSSTSTPAPNTTPMRTRRGASSSSSHLAVPSSSVAAVAVGAGAGASSSSSSYASPMRPVTRSSAADAWLPPVPTTPSRPSATAAPLTSPLRRSSRHTTPTRHSTPLRSPSKHHHRITPLTAPSPGTKLKTAMLGWCMGDSASSVLFQTLHPELAGFSSKMVQEASAAAAAAAAAAATSSFSTALAPFPSSPSSSSSARKKSGAKRKQQAPASAGSGGASSRGSKKKAPASGSGSGSGKKTKKSPAVNNTSKSSPASVSSVSSSHVSRKRKTTDSAESSNNTSAKKKKKSSSSKGAKATKSESHQQRDAKRRKKSRNSTIREEDPHEVDVDVDAEDEEVNWDDWADSLDLELSSDGTESDIVGCVMSPAHTEGPDEEATSCGGGVDVSMAEEEELPHLPSSSSPPHTHDDDSTAQVLPPLLPQHHHQHQHSHQQQLYGYTNDEQEEVEWYQETPSAQQTPTASLAPTSAASAPLPRPTTTATTSLTSSSNQFDLDATLDQHLDECDGDINAFIAGSRTTNEDDDNDL